MFQTKETEYQKATKARARALEHVLAGSRSGEVIAYKDKVITILSGPKLHDTSISLEVSVTRNGVDVTPKNLNPVFFVNLPVLVEDPLGPVIINGVSHRRDPRAALTNALSLIVDRL